MISHKVNDLESFIAGWYIDKEICDKLIDYFYASDNKVQGLGGPKIGEVDSKSKISMDLHVDMQNPVVIEYCSKLYKVIEKYIELYPYCNSYSSFGLKEVFNIQYYKPSEGYFKYHTERFSPQEPFVSRHLVFMTYLNDVTEGGETEWYHQKLKISPEKGLTVIWPSDWTFTHRGLPSLSQEKYIATGWLSLC